MKIAGPILFLAAVCTQMCLSAASAQQLHERFALRPAQVVLAMEGLKLPTHGVQVRLAAPVTSSSSDTKLEIKSVAVLSPREMRLRISCGDRSECLPFFALATYTEPIDTASFPMKFDDKAAGTEQSVPPTKLVVDFTASAPVQFTATTLLRSGSPATLALDSDKVHVRIDVVCLESGAAGDKVRVTTRDHKLVYLAQIVTPKLLKGTF